METTTFRINNIKKPDLPYEILSQLGYDFKPDAEGDGDEMLDKHFRHAEYFDLEIEVDEDLNIIGGQILEQ